MRPALKGLLEFLVTSGFTVMFLNMGLDIYNNYVAEPTGTSLERKMSSDIPFPSVSICTDYFFNRRAFEELGFPIHPMRPPPKLSKDPSLLYRLLSAYEMNVTENLWRFYPGLTDVLKGNINRRIYNDRGLDAKCSVGHLPCSIPEKLVGMPEPGKDEFEYEVPAGKWISRLMADSNRGWNFMCHTMKPNVSVDFSVAGGNKFSLLWGVPLQDISYWHVYVHDRNEEVVLSSHAIETLPLLIPNRNGMRVKAMIIPKLIRLPEPSEVHPCIVSRDYSKNRCDLEWGWTKRIQEVKALNGDRFGCLLPGIVTGKEDVTKLPVCKHYTPDEPNGTMGLSDLTKDFNTETRKPILALTGPPIGKYKSTSPCKRRCSGYSYRLIESKEVVYDEDLADSDMVLYFPSQTVETWYSLT